MEMYDEEEDEFCVKNACVANGTGQQGIVAYVNLASYYLIGLPLGVILGYVFKLQVEVSRDN